MMNVENLSLSQYMETIKVNQDGAEFYNSETGKLIFASGIRVRDFDLDAAMEARIAFKQFCLLKNISPIFEQYRTEN